MRRHVALASFILLAGLAATAVRAGAPADFRLQDIDGKWFQLQDVVGQKVVYVSFWATWCKPCKRELPHLQKLYEEFGGKGFLPIAVNTDPPANKSRIKPYVKQHGFTFPFLLDPDNNVHDKYNPTRQLPYAVLVDRSGRLHEGFSGYKTGDEVRLRGEVIKLLGLDPTACPPAASESAPAEAAPAEHSADDAPAAEAGSGTSDEAAAPAP